MRSVRSNLECLKNNLASENYVYECDYGPVDAPNENDVRACLELFGDRNIDVPPSIVAFYLTMGLVEFSGPVPENWRGCDYPDPISIAPFSPGYVEGEFEIWEELKSDFPATDYAYMISGDYIHKAGFSGGCYYLIFDGEEDAVIQCNENSYRFCDYLKLCMEWAGFPGLRHVESHNWPLNQLKLGFTDLNESIPA